MRIRRVILAVTALFLIGSVAWNPDPVLITLLIFALAGCALGFLPASSRNVELTLTFDMVSALAAWFVLDRAADLAILVPTIGILGSMILPVRHAFRLTIGAALAESARLALFFVEAPSWVATPTQPLLGDLAMGMGTRVAVLVWGVGMVRMLTTQVSDAALAARSSDLQFRAAFDDAPIGMGLFDMLGRVVRLNSTFKEFTGISDETLAMSPVFLADLITSSHRERVLGALRRAVTSPGGRIDIECETAGGPTSRRLLSISVAGVATSSSVELVPKVLVQARDITGQRQAESAAGRQHAINGVIQSVSTTLVETPVAETASAVERSLHTLGQHLAADAVWLVAGGDTPALPEGGLAWWSVQGHSPSLLLRMTESWRRLVSDVPQGRSLMLNSAADAPSWLAAEMGALEVGSLLAVPLPIQPAPAMLVVVRPQSSGRWTSDDSGLAWVVAELVSHALEALAAQSRLEMLLRSKSEFVARVSHELRTPMTVVMGLAEELVVDSGRATSELFEDERQDLLGLIAEQSAEMSMVVEDLLVAARVDLGTLTIYPEVVSVAEAVDTVVKVGFGSLNVSCQVDDARTVWADPLRFRQILRNLLVNADRYGGSNVRITVEVCDGRVAVSVADDGQGVPFGVEDQIFEPFEQASHDAGMPDSMGLGLSVSRSLARLMGGDVTYCRDAGWTRFDVSLPAVPAGGDDFQVGEGPQLVAQVRALPVTAPSGTFPAVLADPSGVATT